MMNFKIRRSDDGKALALVEIGFGNAECDYRPSHPEFAEMLSKSGLEFSDIQIPKPQRTEPGPTLEQRVAALEVKVFAKG